MAPYHPLLLPLTNSQNSILSLSPSLLFRRLATSQPSSFRNQSQRIFVHGVTASSPANQFFYFLRFLPVHERVTASFSRAPSLRADGCQSDSSPKEIASGDSRSIPLSLFPLLFFSFRFVFFFFPQPLPGSEI